MQRPTGLNVSATPVAYEAGPNDPGYYSKTDPPTQIRAADMHGLTETLARAIEDIGGLTLDGADDTQLAQTIQPLLAIKAALATTGSANTTWRRIILACGSTTASGNGAAALASTSSTASGAASLVGASTASTASGAASAILACSAVVADGAASALLAAVAMSALGARSAVIASLGTGDPADNAARASCSAVVASEDCETLAAAGGTDAAVIASHECDTDGDEAAVVASRSDGGDRCVAYGAAVAILASSDGTTTPASAEQCAALACGGCTVDGQYAAVVASENCETDAAAALVLGSSGSKASGTRTVVIGGSNVEIATPGMIGGGDNVGAITFNGTDQGLKWSMSKEGYLVCARVTSSGQVVASGAVRMTGLGTYADDAAAGAGGLTTGDLYMETATRTLKVKA